MNFYDYHRFIIEVGGPRSYKLNLLMWVFPVMISQKSHHNYDLYKQVVTGGMLHNKHI